MALINEKLRKSIWFHLLVVIGLCVAIYMLFFASLGWITNHGEEYIVPNTLGRDVPSVIRELEHLGFDVDVDSTFDLKKKPLTVLAQRPDTGSTVKRGRTIFLTVNKAKAPFTSMPNLTGLSYNSALMVLKSNKLLLGDTSYVPDIANGAILEQKYKGQPIRVGDMVPQGAKIDLVIGDGLSNVMIDVPDVVGEIPYAAMAILSSRGIVVDVSWDSDIRTEEDSLSAVVYQQSPSAVNHLNEVNQIREGDRVGIWIGRSTRKNHTNDDQNGSGRNKRTESYESDWD